MAIIWQQQKDNQLYEVRTAGASTRLYKDGVLHSQYNENHPITGQVWDLLMLPAFFYPPNQIQRILVLGVGGGTVIRQLNHFLSPKQIVGIDLDDIHLKIAKRFFGLKKKNITLYSDNAIQWLSDYRGTPFDMIIEDIFIEENGEPVRARTADESWARCILKNLAPKGLAVLNFTSALEAKKSAFITSSKLEKQTNSCFLLDTTRNANVVGAFLKTEQTARNLRTRLYSIPELDPRKKSARLRYRILKIK